MVRTWHGREWEDYCVLLLQKRYSTTNPHSLQLVPDKHRGDLGLEAFSHDGVAYQCYAAEEPLAVEACYERQRDKLTTDLQKLRIKTLDVKALLGDVMLRKYVFMVHRHDSRFLISHASSKSAEVRSWGLPFIHSSFQIVIETDDSYVVERESIHAIPTPLVESPVITPADREHWAEQNADLRRTALAKLEKVHPSRSSVESVVEALVAQYIKGENTLERLRSISPEVHRGIISARAQREETLVLDFPRGATDSRQLMPEIARGFMATLLKDFPLLSESVAQAMAWGTVADWLMRCPLDFEESP